MSVLIKGMEMPESCLDCDFCSGIVMPDGSYFCDCPVIHGGDDVRHPDCPLVEIHIIDADELKESIDNAQTVVEAEGEDT